MSNHHTTHKSAEARELAAERRTAERVRMQERRNARNDKYTARSAFKVA